MTQRVAELSLVAPAESAPADPFESCQTVSRFSLALLRHEPDLPYTGVPKIDRSSDAVPFLHRLVGAEPFETLGALFLTVRGRPIGHTIAFRGTLASCRVGPRPLLASALLANAAKLLVFHNHPSGDPSPSPEDVDFSRRLNHAAELLGFAVTDFLVLGEPPFYCSIRRGGSILRSTAPRLPTRRRRRPKYRHPDEPALTWAGTGFIPVWLREEIESGASLAEFLVDGARVTAAAARQEREIRERAGDHPARTK